MSVIADKPTLSGHEKRLVDLECDVVRHEKFITGNGNGGPGAKTDIILLQKAVADIKETVKEIKTSMSSVTKALWGLAASVIGAVIIWLITVYFPAHM
jgi:chromosome segregation ATPase